MRPISSQLGQMARVDPFSKELLKVGQVEFDPQAKSPALRALKVLL